MALCLIALCLTPEIYVCLLEVFKDVVGAEED